MMCIFVSQTLVTWILFHAASAQYFSCTVTVRDLRVYNWDLSLLTLQWDVAPLQSLCRERPVVEYQVTLETNKLNKTVMTTRDKNITFTGLETCFLTRAHVRSLRHAAGPLLSLNLRGIFYGGDDLTVRGVDVDYAESYQLVTWQKGRSVCIDGYGISYRGVNITSPEIHVPFERNWYRINQNTSAMRVIELRPLHRRVEIQEEATRVDVTSRNARATCLGKSPGAVQELTKNNLYIMAPQYWHLHWTICHYKTYRSLVEATQYEVSTIPPSKISSHLRAEDFSKEYVFLNITDICKVRSFTVSSTRNGRIIGPDVGFYLESYLYMDTVIHDLQVTRLTSNLITVRWQRMRKRVASLNCTAVYVVTFTKGLEPWHQVSDGRVAARKMEFSTTDNYYTYKGNVSNLESVSVQMTHEGRWPYGPSPVVNLTQYVLPHRQDSVVTLRVASVKRDSVRFEWPEYRGPPTGSNNNNTKYRVRLTQGNFTPEVVTSDLDLEWEGDPCILSELTVQPIRENRSLGEPYRLNLTAFFYEDVVGFHAIRHESWTEFSVPRERRRHCVTQYVIQVEPGGHTMYMPINLRFSAYTDTSAWTVSLSACDLTSASVQPIHKSRLVGWPTYYNLTQLRSGNIPKLNVSVDEYINSLYISWLPSKYDTGSMCPQDVQVKINVTSVIDSHFQVVNGSDSDKEVAGLVPCRSYTVTVSTGDDVVHYSKTHAVLSPDPVAILAINGKHVHSTSAVLDLTLKGAAGDCVPDINVICHPPVESDRYHVAMSRSNSATLVIEGLTPDESYYCYLIVSGEQPHSLEIFLKTTATEKVPESKDPRKPPEEITNYPEAIKPTVNQEVFSGRSLLVVVGLFVVFGLTIMYYRTGNVFIISIFFRSKSCLENVTSRVTGATRTPSHRVMEEELDET